MVMERLHTLTHELPGVPAHYDRHAATHRHPRARHQHPHHRNRAHAHTRAPRVLVRWQGWIASLASRGRD